MPVRLSDYRPFPFTCEQLSLHFQLNQSRTIVKATSIWTRKSDGPFRLDGEHLELLSVKVDGVTVSLEHFQVDDKGLTLLAPADQFTLETEVAIDPEANTALSGLYLSSGRLCTQCEAEGFRRITFWADRPDVMTRFDVEMLADPRAFPTLLSNGDLIETGKVDDDLHFARWRDPHLKPSYLFALVAGSFDVLKDSFTTLSGRVVELGIYVDIGDADRAHYAMDSLKRSMRWDEEVFGREYDLDVFNIVAVRDFNFGAMENKGLNVFNSAYVLADAQSATDMTFEAIESIVAHEYFHNWTGNRITCRDWFQLSLKEGLTVYRDQEFTADQRSRAVARIKNVLSLRQRQFAEDAGPLAHPVRPSAYASIDNFYTATVYDKGAEVIRMLSTLIGKPAFDRGMQLYFSRFDGTAATVENFISCFEASSGQSLSAFMSWYSQAGTPEVTVGRDWHAQSALLSLNLRQRAPATPNQSEKHVQVIPLRLAVFRHNGEPVVTTLNGKSSREHLVVLDNEAMTLTLDLPDVAADEPAPLVSINRGFSAPIKVANDLSPDEVACLAACDDDPFTQWDSLQSLGRKAVLDTAVALRDGEPAPDVTATLRAMVSAFQRAQHDPAFAALLLGVPTVSELLLDMPEADLEALHLAREGLRRTLASLLSPVLVEWASARNAAPFSPDAAAAGRRAVKGAALSLLGSLGHVHEALLLDVFMAADNMTDSMAALRALAATPGPSFDTALSVFHDTWRDRPLVMDQWFSVQASATRADSAERITRLLGHPAFDLRNPNRARSVLGALGQVNLPVFHRADGWGYRFLADAIAQADALNPALAARLAGAFESWRRLEPKRREKAHQTLKALIGRPGLSKNLTDILARSLA
jgi:aminopeptidase N